MLRQRNQRVGADIKCSAEAVAACLDKWPHELFTRGEGGAVHDEIKAAELAFNRREDSGNLRVAGDVARKDERPVEALGEVAHVLF
jgi:hypothetical protein